MGWLHSTTDEEILRQKQDRLAALNSQFDSTVSVVENMVGRLNTIGENIGKEIEEIDAFQERLAETKSGLLAAKERSARVAKNFGALLVAE